MQIIKNEIMLGDCMDLLKELPDKSISLAITDPPYGIKRDKGFGGFGGFGKPIKRTEYKGYGDEKTPELKYFNELTRVSENSIIWGGNYYTDKLPVNGHWLFWDKNNTMPTFSDGELAWTSFDRVSVKKIDIEYNGLIGKEKEKRIHANQKPVALYRWILQKYAKPGQIILDTHSGSGSLACACHIEKFDFIAIEKDPHYHALSVKRLEELRSQGVLF